MQQQLPGKWVHITVVADALTICVCLDEICGKIKMIQNFCFCFPFFKKRVQEVEVPGK